MEFTTYIYFLSASILLNEKFIRRREKRRSFGSGTFKRNNLSYIFGNDRRLGTDSKFNRRIYRT